MPHAYLDTQQGKDSVEVLGYAGTFRCPEITATFVQRLGDALWR